MFTLGFFVLILNTLLFYLTGWLGSQFHFGFTVSNFWAAFLGALVTSAVSFVLTLLFKDEAEEALIITRQLASSNAFVPYCRYHQGYGKPQKNTDNYVNKVVSFNE